MRRRRVWTPLDGRLPPELSQPVWVVCVILQAPYESVKRDAATSIAERACLKASVSPGWGGRLDFGHCLRAEVRLGVRLRLCSFARGVLRIA